MRSWMKCYRSRSCKRRLESILLVAAVVSIYGTSYADQTTDWINTTTNPEIQYRVQVLQNSQACYLDFRDQQQGTGNTTFDVAVDYKSTTLGPDGLPIVKTDSEHLVTTPTHTANSRIANCAGVAAASASFVRRH